MSTIKRKISPELVGTDVIFLFQQPFPSTQAHSISKLLPKKGWKQKVTTFLQCQDRNFVAVILCPIPMSKWISLPENYHTSGTGLCQGTCPLQVVFPAASFLLLEGLQVCRFVWRLMVEKKVCMYIPWQEKRNKKHTITGTESQNPCYGLRRLANDFRFWK